MGKGTRRLAVLGVLFVASGFHVGAAAAQPAIDVGPATGPAGGTATFSVTLTSNGSAVAGTQNDIAFDGTNISIGTTTSGNCAITIGQSCNVDADCPALASPFTGNEPCVNKGGPACAVSAATGKGGFFSFLPAGCTPGTDCTGIRALILAVNNTSTAIPDGTLYTCTVNIASSATGGPFALTNSGVIAADTTQHQIAGAAGASGSISLGPPPTGFLVCDVAPRTSGDDIGQFGNQSLNIADVKAIFKASLDPTQAPPAGTARFSAMNSAPVDAPPTCGGNTSLNIADVKLCFRESLDSSLPRFIRSSAGGDCTSAQQ